MTFHNDFTIDYYKVKIDDTEEEKVTPRAMEGGVPSMGIPSSCTETAKPQQAMGKMTAACENSVAIHAKTSQPIASANATAA